MTIPHPASGGVVTAIGGRVHSFMPGIDIVTAPHTLLAGQVFAKFSVLGKVTASGKLKLCASAAGDGSEVPYAILQEDINTTSPVNADLVYNVVVQCKINPEVLVLGVGHTIASVTDALRARGIHLDVPY